MGKKIEIKKIEEITKRQVTFSKRRSSLLKKAEEIAICCDVDVLFVALSPADRLSKFCSQKRYLFAISIKSLYLLRIINLNDLLD